MQSYVIRMHMYAYIAIYVRMCMYVCVYIYIYLYLYVHCIKAHGSVISSQESHVVHNCVIYANPR